MVEQGAKISIAPSQHDRFVGGDLNMTSYRINPRLYILCVTCGLLNASSSATDDTSK